MGWFCASPLLQSSSLHRTADPWRPAAKYIAVRNSAVTLTHRSQPCTAGCDYSTLAAMSGALYPLMMRASRAVPIASRQSAQYGTSGAMRKGGARAAVLRPACDLRVRQGARPFAHAGDHVEHARSALLAVGIEARGSGLATCLHSARSLRPPAEEPGICRGGLTVMTPRRWAGWDWWSAGPATGKHGRHRDDRDEPVHPP